MSKKYVAISPDGFTLEFEPIDHDSIERANAEILQWKERYKAQGHYTNNRREEIPYDKIQYHCDIQVVGELPF